jgi:hypothetical protein
VGVTFRMSAGPVLAATVLLVGCGASSDEGEFWRLYTESREREMLPAVWSEMWQFGGEVQDTMLQRPQILRADENGPVLYDGAAQRVLAFDTQGRLRWSYGRRGEGPDEFMDVRDLQLFGSDTYVLDPRNGRITVLNSEGAVRRRIPLHALEAQAFNLAPFADGVVVVTASQTRPVVVLDQNGVPVADVAFPWQPFASTSMLLRQGTVATAGDQWAFAFLLGNAWFRFSGREAIGRAAFLVEQVPPPEVVEQSSPDTRVQSFARAPTCTACSISVTDGKLLVQHGGHSEYRFQVIDGYDLASGEYLGSLQLPDRVLRAAVHGSVAYLLVTDPAPSLRAYRAVVRTAVLGL